MNNFLKKNWIALSFIVLILIVGSSFAVYALIYMPEKLKNKDNEIQKKFNQIEQNSDLLTAEEINLISRSIVHIECDFGTIKTTGSGTYFHRSFFDIPSFVWTKPDGRTPCLNPRLDTSCQRKEINYTYKGGYIVTNAHVALLPKGDGIRTCDVYAYESEKNQNIYFGSFSYNKEGNELSDVLDFAILKEDKINFPRDLLDQYMIQDQFGLPYTTWCSGDLTGHKVYIFGYPISGESEGNRYNLIVSEGIISGRDEYQRYFTTAKVDSGNSGGLAVAKINGKACMVGIPTWVSSGKFENLGVIQNYDIGLGFFIHREVNSMVN